VCFEQDSSSETSAKIGLVAKNITQGPKRTEVLIF
jgi:hypothetical protein